MARARRREMWNHTSHVLATLINCHRDPKKRAVKPNEVNPLERKPQTSRKVKRGTVDGLKVFLPTRKPKQKRTRSNEDETVS